MNKDLTQDFRRLKVDNWTELFEKQKKYRNEKNISGSQFLRMANPELPRSLLQYIYGDTTMKVPSLRKDTLGQNYNTYLPIQKHPSIRKGTIGYRLRTFIEELDPDQAPLELTTSDKVDEFAYANIEELKKLHVISVCYEEKENQLLIYIDKRKCDKKLVETFFRNSLLDVAYKLIDAQYLKYTSPCGIAGSVKFGTSTFVHVFDMFGIITANHLLPDDDDHLVDFWLHDSAYTLCAKPMERSTMYPVEGSRMIYNDLAFLTHFELQGTFCLYNKNAHIKPLIKKKIGAVQFNYVRPFGEINFVNEHEVRSLVSDTHTIVSKAGWGSGVTNGRLENFVSSATGELIRISGIDQSFSVEGDSGALVVTTQTNIAIGVISFSDDDYCFIVPIFYLMHIIS